MKGQRARWKQGDDVESCVDAQGMKRGQRFRVLDAIPGSYGLVTYELVPAGELPIADGRNVLQIINGHLVLREAAKQTKKG